MMRSNENRWEICPNCEGDGCRHHQIVDAEDMGVEGPIWTETSCDRCGGTGKIRVADDIIAMEAERLMRAEAPHLFR